jgi:TfoX/Sxy family transcriptional regulator of competence genes
MAYNEKLADRIRASLAGVRLLEEKKMFSGMCFMVNGKMCVCVSHDEMMCRIGPEKFEAALERTSCRAMIHNGKAMKGFVYISEEGMKSKKDFDYWINLALEFNSKAKSSKTKKKK